jgi:hypothetical protein
MAVIIAVSVDEALIKPPTKEPSARTLRTRQLEQDAEDVVAAVNRTGAAHISISVEDLPTARYLSGLRAALGRKGHTQLILQKRRGRDEIVAWNARPEDQDRIRARRETGRRLGQLVKQRARKSRRASRRKAG